VAAPVARLVATAPRPVPVSAVSAVAVPVTKAPEAHPITIAAAAVVTPMPVALRPIEPASHRTAETPDRAASEAAVQFAATASEESARSFWQSLVRRFPDVLGRRSPLVIRYEHGGTVFWRVRTDGFGAVSEAQTLCARMRAGGQDCFVPRS
jgi:hypothetical protein